MVKLTIDGKELSVTEGTSIMEAARSNGIDIPGFCYHPRLDSFGACRVCMVHVTERGRTRDKFACAQPVGEGMDVVTKSDKINKYVKSVTEYLLVHHPLDCPVCDKSGECELQDVTFKFNLTKSRIKTKRSDEPSDKSNPVLEFNHNRCILCGRCSRVCGEVQGIAAIDFQGRGFHATVGTPAGTALDCEFCGQCLSVCPVGAIQDRVFNFRARPWELKKTLTTCTYCSVGCSVALNSKNNEVLRVTSNDEDGINGGNLCSKGRFGFQFINSNERVLEPLIKKDGKLVPASWDEALETIAAKFKEIKEANGADSIGGIGSEKCTNEDNYLFQKFFRTVVGSNNIDNMANIRAPYLNELILESVANGICCESLENVVDADMILLFGTDITEELPVAGNLVRKAIKKNNASLVIANTRNVGFKSIAKSEHKVRYNFGAETAFINALLKVMISNDVVDEVKLDEYVGEYGKFKESLEDTDLDELLKIAGVTKDEITAIAYCFESAKSRFIFVGKEVLNCAHGEESMRSLINLAYFTMHGINAKNETDGFTNIFFPREHNNSQGVNDMGVIPRFLPGYQTCSDSKNKEKFEKKWATSLPDCSLENGNLIDSAIQGNLKALYIMGDNVLLSHIDGREAREAINKLDFLVVQDSFLNETGYMADVVLPSVTFAEKEGTFVNLGKVSQKVNKAIEPLGNAKTDGQIFSTLAGKMGATFTDASASEIMCEIKELVPLYSHMNYNNLIGEEASWVLSAENHKYPEFHVVKSEVSDDKKVAKKFPLILSTGSVMFHLGTYSHKSPILNEIYSECKVEINPQDAKEHNIFDGDSIEVVSPNSELKLKAKLTKKSPKGIVFIPSSFEGVPVNLLIERNCVPRVKLIKAGK